jgi:hypothetical protein
LSFAICHLSLPEPSGAITNNIRTRRRHNSKWQMTNGKWQMANGKWQMANDKWQMTNGK